MSFDGVMLASPTSTIARSVATAIDLLADRDGWVHELKADGIRALITVDGNHVDIINRRGADITFRYPDVVSAIRPLNLRGTFDGEIVVMVDGRIDFPGAHKRDGQGSARGAARAARDLPAVFLAFDVLTLAGQDLRSADLPTRREHLSGTGLALLPQTDDLRALWAFVVDNDMEGVVSKRTRAPYVAKRSRDWIKLKRTKTLSAIVVGVQPGRGQRRETFGALELGLIDENKTLRRIGAVGSGFTRHALELIADNPAGFVVEVAYLDVSPTGSLRQPVFVGLRDDITILDCTTRQIEDRVRSRAASHATSN